jgi:hypothetical protein
MQTINRKYRMAWILRMDPLYKWILGRRQVSVEKMSLNFLKLFATNSNREVPLPVPCPCPSRESGGFVIETHVRFGYSVVSVTVPSVF